MSRPILCAIFLLLVLWGSPSQALYLDLNVFYATDSVSYTSTANHNRTLIDAAIGFGLDRKDRWIIGWNYGSFSTTDVDSTTTSYSTTDMGLKFGHFLSKSKAYSLFLTYNLLVTSKFTTAGGAEQEWRGSSLKAEFGYHLWLSETSNLAIRLNYYQGSIKELISGGSTLTTVGYSRNFIYPSLGYMMVF